MTRFYYFFRPTLKKHVHLYHSWVMAARSQGLEMTLVTLLPRATFKQERAAVRFWGEQQHVEIHIARRRNYARSVHSFFKRRCRFGRRAVIHLRHQQWEPLAALRTETAGRLRYLIEYEGDALMEAEYLKAHPYKPGFYDAELQGYADAISKQQKALVSADHILVNTDSLKKAFCDRWTDLNLVDRISSLPTGASTVDAGFDLQLRKRIRARHAWEDRLVVVYAGNVHYSWQSLSSCLNAFKTISRKINEKAFLLLLIYPEDWPIARDFINHAGLAADDYLLTHASPSEMAGYTCASDIGVVLRPNHPAMSAATPGKFGCYMLKGLPTLISAGVGKYAEMVRNDGVLPVVQSIDCQEEIETCVRRLAAMTDEERRGLVRWAKENVASAAYAHDYADVLRSVERLTKDYCREFGTKRNAE